MQKTTQQLYTRVRKRRKYSHLRNVIAGGAKERPKFCVTITAREFMGIIFFAHLKINMYSYLLSNFSDLINDTTLYRRTS